MPVWHGEIGKKRTGGQINLYRRKKKFELGGNPLMTKLGKEKKKIVKTKGGGKKIKALSAQIANVYDPTTKKTQKVKILEIVKTPSNPHFARRGIITKGSIITTELGLVKITSRPSQHGIISGIALEKEKA